MAWIDQLQQNLQNNLTEHHQISMDLSVATWIHSNKITTDKNLEKLPSP